MQMEEVGLCQMAGMLRNSVLTFTGQAATSDGNLCTLSLCVIGLEQQERVCVHSHAWTRGHTCVTETCEDMCECLHGRMPATA